MAFSFSSTIKNKHTNKGFTLIELIIVIAIMAILSVVIAFSVTEMIKRAKVARAQGDLNNIGKAIRLLELDTNRDPGGINLTPCKWPVTHRFAIANSPADEVGLLEADPLIFPKWKGPYMEEIPALDPWGMPYYFSGDYQCDKKTKGCEEAGTVKARVIFSSGANRSQPDVADSDNVVVVLCHE